MSLVNQSSPLKQLSLRIKFFLGSLLYLSYAPYAYLYSRRRDHLEKAFPVPPVPESEKFNHPGKLVRAEAIERGAQFYFEQAELEAVFLAHDLVRLTWKPGILPIPYGIHKSNWAGVETQLHESEMGWTVATDALRVTVRFDGQIQFCDAQGKVLREELPPQRNGEAWSQQVKLRPEEHIYGLGERSSPLNLRSPHQVKKKDEPTGREITGEEPASYRMWNYDAAGMYAPGSDPMYLCIPLQMSLHHEGCYLVFYENSFPAKFKYEDVASIDFEGGALRYYVTTGSPAQVLERYTELTGRSPLPAKWALGYHQSRWGYRTEQAVRESVQKFQELDLPLSAVHMDIDAQVGYRAFTLDPDRFPQMGAFMKELRDQDVRFITILNPGIKYSRHSNLFLEGCCLDLFCKHPDGNLVTAPVWPGWCVFPDYTNPAARKWWSRQYEYLLDLGLSGFWHDMNEPAAFITWGDRSLPPRTTLHHMEGRGGDHREAHNVYGYLQSKAAYESLCGHRPHLRPFIVTRAGWAGVQRYAWVWTGDVECTWEALKMTISTVLNLGLSGVPHSGPDIGGFQGNPTAELYLRWFQMSTFFSFYRSHCSNNVEYRAPWTYGEPYLSILRNFLKLRYRLLPYFYTLSWETSKTGISPMRPTFWADPGDARLWAIDDQFMLGDGLLICPVVEEGGRSRPVTLPKGRWYNFWTDQVLEGTEPVEVEATLETIPVLVKAGTILPMEENNVLTLHLYAPAEGTTEYTLYTDAGDGYGDSRRDRFRLVHHGHGLELFWEEEGDYPFPYSACRVKIHGIQAKQIWVEGNELQPKGNGFESSGRFRQAFIAG